MKLQITFPDGFHAFCKIGNNKEKIIIIDPGTYEVMCSNEDPEFYIFYHQTFKFQLSRETWDSGEFSKTFKVTVKEIE